MVKLTSQKLENTYPNILTDNDFTLNNRKMFKTAFTLKINFLIHLLNIIRNPFAISLFNTIGF